MYKYLHLDALFYIEPQQRPLDPQTCMVLLSQSDSRSVQTECTTMTSWHLPADSQIIRGTFQVGRELRVCWACRYHICALGIGRSAPGVNM